MDSCQSSIPDSESLEPLEVLLSDLKCTVLRKAISSSDFSLRVRCLSLSFSSFHFLEEVSCSVIDQLSESDSESESAF